MEKPQRADMLHGVLFIALFAFAAFYVAQFDWVRSLSLSPLIVGIVLGMVYANTLRPRLPEGWVPGVKFCSKEILRLGVILYGSRLTFQQVAAVGLPAIAVDCIVVVGTLLLGLLFGRLLHVDKETTLMTSTGSAICGAAAVLGAEPVVRCAPHKTAVAVSTVVIFGTLSMFLYPVLYRTGVLDGMTEQQVAIYTGGTLHEVAHVVGAGNAIESAGAHVADTATITKMIRVMLLAPVLIVMSLLLSAGGAQSDGQKRKITIPWFALWFVVAIGVNSLLQSLSFVPSDWLNSVVGYVSSFDTFLLTMAMTALGAETSIDKFRQAGSKPFLLAACIYVWLVVGGYFVTLAIA